MLEVVDFSMEKLSKDAYKERHDAAIERLVLLQQEARQAGLGLVVLFEGWNGAGKGSRISDLMYELDARSTSVHVTPGLSAEAVRSFPGRDQGVTGFYPDMQEFWRALGARGTMTFYLRGWYTVAVQRMLADEGASCLRERECLGRYLTAAETFERQLAADGYVVVKFFVHMTKKGQKKRLEKLAHNPATAWRVPDAKLESAGNYDTAYRMYDELLEGSSFGFAPWHVLNGEDKRRTNLAIVETLVEAIEGGLAARADSRQAAADTKVDGSEAAAEQTAGDVHDGDEAAAAARAERSEADPAVRARAVAVARAQSACAPVTSRFAIADNVPRVDGMNHTLVLDKDAYDDALKDEQERLHDLECRMYVERVPLIVMYEGWDAAGKGGNIKRVAQALDARAYTIFPSPAPTPPELAHPHLWRYWTRLPKAGHVGIYDRSWYGRVLVERVEGFATTEQWARAYDEINEFERELVEWGAILVKFWVEVSADEQLRRFHERERDPAKQWKITPDDWRNREKYPQYKAAIDDMFRLTSTTFAPWHVLESDDKRYARIKALRIINKELERRLS